MYDLSLFSLKNKTVLVTGSGSGIGLSLAEGLAMAGAGIILNGRNVEKLQAARELLEKKGTNVYLLPFDVVNAGEAKAAIDRFEAETGPIDILVNNAGINHRGPFEEMSEERWKQVMDININGAMIVSQAVGPHMIRRKAGKIINICSMQSELGRKGIVPYAVSKGGIKMLTRAFCVEWGEHNIQVNGIGPGYFQTEMTRPLAEDPVFDSWLKNRTPAHRWGDPKELVGAAIFLASDASSYVNGHVLNVDGGLLASV